MASRKVTLLVQTVVNVNMDEGVDMDELELDMYSDNDAVDVQDCQITKLEVIDSK
jgi:hypothetical protein